MPESRIRRKRTDAASPDAAAKAARSATAKASRSADEGSGGVVTGGSRRAGAVTAGAAAKGAVAEDAKRPRKPVRTGPKPTPRWWVPLMLGLMIAGLLWIVVFYLSGFRQYPVPQIGAWNLAAGFGLIIVGFAMTTRWR